MAKITITDLSTLVGAVNDVNNKFQQIEDELNNKVLYRDNPVGEDNTLQSDIDLGNNDVLNVNTLQVQSLTIGGIATGTLAFQGNYYIASSQPTSLIEGDLWYDTVNDKLGYYDGSQVIFITDENTEAQAAKVAAETAQGLSEAARDTAEGYRDTAETHKDDAQTAKTAAENAQSYSEEWANKAEDSLISTAAGGDGSTEYSSRHWAAKAAASEAAAAGYTDTFDDRFLGAKTSDPSLDNDGDALLDGAIYWDTTNNVMKVYDLGNTVWRQMTPTTSDQANINTVVGIQTEVGTVAGDSLDIQAVSGLSADIQLLADIEDGTTATSAISNVGDNISAVVNAAANIASINNFGDTYFIGATAPASPTEGDLWFDTSVQAMKVYGSGGWQLAGSSINGTSSRYDYVVGTASGSYDGNTTTFPATYDAGYVDVYLNGIKLKPTTDFTATNGTSVVLASAASSGDELAIVGYGTFQLANFSVGDANDVDLAGVADGDLLQYSSSAGDFVPKNIDEVLPDQSSANGQYLTSDGTNASWSAISEYSLPTQTGNAGKYLTTDGTNESWGAIASDQLTTSLPIATGETCTAGKILSINSSGEVGEYPATPTLGTVRSGGDSYFAFTHDGSRALVIDVTYPSQTQVTYTYTGYVIDASNNATAGTPQTRTLSSGITGNVSHGGYKYCLYDSTNDKFVVYTMHYARDTSANHFVDYDLQAIDVNSSTGNLTMGSVNNVYSNTEGGGPDNFTVGMSKIKDGHYIISNSSGRAQSRPFTYQCVTLSGTTFTISTDADASAIVGRLYYSDNDARRATVYTAGNYVVGLNSNDAFRATYTTRNVSAVTTQANIFTDNENGNIWWHTISSTLAIAAYRDSDLITRLRLFSIDSSTGVLTAEDTIVIENTGYHDNWQFSNQDSTGFLIMYRTAALGTYTVRAVGLSGSTFTGKTLPTGFTSQTGMMFARPTATTGEYLFFRNGGDNHQSLTVTAYSSDPFVAIGAVNSTTSTSPATVVVGGVIDGFTGLTPGEFYYVANTYDGDVSTSSATGIAVGTAISSTKIAIRMTEV